MPTSNNTTYGESLDHLIAEFMNLVDACERKSVQFETVDGFTLEDCRDTITQYLGLLGWNDEQIEKIWTGEIQLTSS